MTVTPNDDHIQERIIAGSLLYETAHAMSKRFDIFASWLLAGFGGAVALMLSNREIASLLPTTTMRGELKIFIWAVIIAVIQKYLAILVISGAEGAALERTLVKQHLKDLQEKGVSPTLDGQVIDSEFIRGLFQPARFIAEWMGAKAAKGDFAAGGRQSMKVAQIQTNLVVLEVVLFLIALGRIVNALPKV